MENVTQSKQSVSSVRSPSDIERTSSDSDGGSLDNSSRSATPPPSSERRKSSSSDGKISMSNISSQDAPTNTDPINNLNRLYESLNQRSYFFDYYVKLGGSKHTKVRIDVSGEQIRFDVLERTSRLPWQNMPLTTQRLVDCNLLNKDKNKKKGKYMKSFLLLIGQKNPFFRSYESLSCI